MLVLTSCQTTKKENEATDYIVFPDFPDPTNEVNFHFESGNVEMTLEYWLSITNYVIEIREIEAIIEGNNEARNSNVFK